MARDSFCRADEFISTLNLQPLESGQHDSTADQLSIAEKPQMLLKSAGSSVWDRQRFRLFCNGFSTSDPLRIILPPQWNGVRTTCSSWP